MLGIGADVEIRTCIGSYCIAYGVETSVTCIRCGNSSAVIIEYYRSFDAVALNEVSLLKLYRRGYVHEILLEYGVDLVGKKLLVGVVRNALDHVADLLTQRVSSI